MSFKTIIRHWNCSLSSLATAGKDENGLKVDIFGPNSLSFNEMQNPAKNCYMVNAPLWNLFEIFFITGAFFEGIEALRNDSWHSWPTDSNIYPTWKPRISARFNLLQVCQFASPFVSTVLFTPSFDVLSCKLLFFTQFAAIRTIWIFVTKLL